MSPTHLNTPTLILPNEVLEIIGKFQENNFEIFIVGGASRTLLGFPDREINNWDFATNAVPQEMLKLFPKRSFYNNKFGTVTIVGKNKSLYEVTTFRTESEYADRRHPDKVEWGKTIEDDLSRRDFTINAIAIKTQNARLQTLCAKHCGQAKRKAQNYELIDPFGGQKDLKEGIIRAVRDPDQRFREDALRMIRAIRIATQLGFIIEEKTFASIQKNAALIKQISGERIRDEIIKILKTDYPKEGFLLLFNSGLLKIIMPELTKGYGVSQAKHHIYDVWTHSLNSLGCCSSKDPIVRLATLLHDIGKPIAMKGEGEERTFHNHEVIGARIVKEIAYRLHFSRKEIDRLYKLVRWHQFSVTEYQTDKAIRRFIKHVDQENLNDIIDLRIGDRLGSGSKRTSWRLELFRKRLLEVQKQPFSLKDLKINGKDVMKILAIPPGKQVGIILNALFNEIEENQQLNKRKYLLSRVKEFKHSS